MHLSIRYLMLLVSYVSSSSHAGDCPRFGCSYVPIFVNHSYDWFEMQFCDPISFDLKVCLFVNLSCRINQ